MDNFEARYRAIVEKRGELKHPTLIGSYVKYETMGYYATWRNDWDFIPEEVAREAVCWWLAGKLPTRYSLDTLAGWTITDHSLEVQLCHSDDPADAILTAWEMILGIKEKP